MAASKKQSPALEEQERVKRILAARDGYEAELIRHKFLLDAYSGTGGFQGRVRQPFAGYWGSAAEVYASVPYSMDTMSDPECSIDTYLDRFPREDVKKFERRVAAAHYPNYIAPAVDVPLSFLFRRDLTREPIEADRLEDWAQNASGTGETWTKMLREVISLRAMILGWCPVLITLPAAKNTRVAKDGTPYRTLADDLGEGRMPHVMPLFPSNILDWFVDEEGVLRAMKTRVDYCVRPDLIGPAEKRTRVTVWTREDGQLDGEGKPRPSVMWFDIAERDGRMSVVEEGTRSHGFVDVPIVVLRRKPVPDDPMRGIPHAGSASDECRRLFNLLSEIDHHLRSTTFAFLQYPVKGGTAVGSVKLGAGNALPLAYESTHEYKFISPDGAVCEAYENRIAKTIEEVYRIQKMEFTRGTTQAQSGTARSFEFESTNRMIADIAAQVASFDERVRRLVSRQMFGYAPDSEQELKIRTVAPTRFDVSEMLKEIEESQAAIDLGLGPTATTHIKKRIALGMLPNLTDEERERIEAEIEQLAADEEERKEQELAAESAARQALIDGDIEDPEVDEDGEPVPAPAPAANPFGAKPKGGAKKKPKGKPKPFGGA